jgi:uncharacterized protein (DUF433 family)
MLTDEERTVIMRALKHPRGRYDAERAGQLSGIPARTLYDWATSGTLVPDWVNARPRGWSYRDVVFARLLGWLRSKHMDRATAADRVLAARSKLARSRINPSVRSDGTIFLFGDEKVDQFTGQQAFDGLAELLDVFELTEPVEGVSLRALRAPNLVHPSTFAFISPWVAGGEPCVVQSRVPTVTLYALRSDRGLQPDAIQRLYPHLSLEAIEDALELEDGLRAA